MAALRIRINISNWSQPGFVKVKKCFVEAEKLGLIEIAPSGLVIKGKLIMSEASNS